MLRAGTVLRAGGAIAAVSVLTLLLVWQVQSRRSVPAGIVSRRSEVVARPRLAGRGQGEPGSPAVAPLSPPTEALAFVVRLSGTVTLAGGEEPVPKGTVELLGEYPTVLMEPLAVTRGEFSGSIRASKGTDVWVYYRDDDALASGAVRVALSAQRDSAIVSLKASRTFACRVRVNNTDGSPSAGAVLKGTGCVFPLAAETNSEGIALLRVPLGTIGFWVRGADGARGVSEYALKLPPDSEPIKHEITLGPPWQRVPVRLSSASPFPAGLPPATVRLSAQGQRQELSLRIDGAGGFAEVPLGERVDIRVDLGDGVEREWAWVAESADSAAVLRVGPGVQLALLVRDVNGSPVPRLACALAGASRGRAWGTQFRTDDAGRASVRLEGGATYEFRPLHADTDAVRVVLGSADTQEAEVRLEHVAQIRGRWSLPFVTLPEGVTVRVRQGSRAWEAAVDPDGSWAMSVPLGAGVSVHVGLAIDGRGLGQGVEAVLGDDGILLDANNVVTLTVRLNLRSGGGATRFVRVSGLLPGRRNVGVILPVEGDASQLEFVGLEPGDYVIELLRDDKIVGTRSLRVGPHADSVALDEE